MAIIETLNLTKKQVDQLEQEIMVLRAQDEINQRKAQIKNYRKLIGRAFRIVSKRSKKMEEGRYYLVLDAISDDEGCVEVLGYDSTAKVVRKKPFYRYVKGSDELYSSIRFGFLTTDRLKVNRNGIVAKLAGYDVTEITQEEFWEQAQFTFDRLKADFKEEFFNNKEKN